MAESIQKGVQAESEKDAELTPTGKSWPVPWESVEGADNGLGAHLSYHLYRLLMSGMGALPDGMREGLLGLLARVGRLVDRSHAAAARKYLQQALGPNLSQAELEGRVLEAYRHFLRVVTETELQESKVPLERIRDHYQVEACDELPRALAAKVGCVVVGPHVGNWEAAASILPRIGFDPFYVIGRPIKNRPLSIAAQADREARGIRVIARKGAMGTVPKIIRAGGHVGMFLDQRGHGRSVLAPFFGRPARSERSAGVLLKRLRAPIVFAACYRTERPWHYRMVVAEVLWPEEVTGLDQKHLAARINAGQEALIRAAPEQYFWLHDRYRKTPLSFPPES